jgi:phospholipid/cholesterol/gamma-HCH transport system substrate-binding protein
MLAGVDEVFNGDRRDFFVGLQLRFNDHDLKSMLPFTPVRP